MNRRNFFTVLGGVIATLITGCTVSKQQTVYLAENKRPGVPGLTYGIAGETPNWWLTDVYLDGKKIEHCYQFDTQAGFVDVYNTNDKSLSKTRMYGKVTTVIREK